VLVQPDQHYSFTVADVACEIYSQGRVNLSGTLHEWSEDAHASWAVCSVQGR